MKGYCEGYVGGLVSLGGSLEISLFLLEKFFIGVTLIYIMKNTFYYNEKDQKCKKIELNKDGYPIYKDTKN